MDPIERRRFLKLLGVQGALLLPPLRARSARAGPVAPAVLKDSGKGNRQTSDVVVVGAGAFGGWTALHLREMGFTVTLVDAYGPGNSRATSGDELRGIRTGYGDRTAYTRWAMEALEQWKRRDEEWARTLERPLFVRTGRLILREEWTNDLRASQRALDEHGVRYEVLNHTELVSRYPQIDLSGIEVGFFEPDSGLLRSRQSCEAVAQAFEQAGGTLRIARAAPGTRAGGRLQDIALTPQGSISAQTFVFACGPWLPKVFPDVMGNRLRTSQSHVYYVGTPVGDNRFMHPNIPNWDVPGSTGFPALSHDNRGMRVRIGGGPPADPDTVDRRIAPEHHPILRRFLGRWFPALESAPVLESRICLFETSVDRNYIIDRHPDFSNVWIVGGGSGHGFKMGPKLGEYVARRVTGSEGSPDLAAMFRLKDEKF